MPSPSPGFTADVTDSIQSWLASPPSTDLADEALGVGQNLDALYSPTIQSSQFQVCIEQFHNRVLRLGTEHRRDLRTQVLPLSPELLYRVRSVADSIKRVALGFERVLTDNDTRAGTPQKRINEASSARALRLLGEYYLTMNQVGLEPDPEIWRVAYRLYALARNERGLEPSSSPVETALFAYKRLLAMITLAPQNMTPAELEWAAEYLTRICAQVHVQEQRPPSLDGTWYWLDPYGPAEPQSCMRREPQENRPLLFFSTAGLARRAGELLAQQEATSDGVMELQITPAFPDVQPAVVLNYLRQHWMAPPKREQPRRKQDYQVEACVGLANLWAVLHGHDNGPQSLISRWTVTNESPGGYAIMQLQGRGAGLVAGVAVALRRNHQDPWNLCVVRWIRSDTIEHIEIGLQMVSRGAIPVQIGFRGTEKPQSMVRALVLPVLPALRQHQAILAPAGTYASRRFTLVSDIERVYVAQCRLLTLDLQTSSIELFQFEIDPYPI